jgi:hypothetical protein
MIVMKVVTEDIYQLKVEVIKKQLKKETPKS